MILPDLNLLLYAYNPHVQQHALALRWWQAAVEADELIALPHEVLFGFVRIATSPRLGPAAVELAAAASVVSGWLALPQVRLLTPSAGHFERVLGLLDQTMGRGAVLSDAVLAAYAIEHHAKLCSNDSDFARFPGLNWVNPLR
jgi:toxin-antitoxin system PIN domain toxin